MGRTILSATQTWVEEKQALMRFVRALRKKDQDLIEELLALSRQHIGEASYASNLYPMDIYLVSMLLEMYKKVKRAESKLEEFGVKLDSDPSAEELPAFPSLLELAARLSAPEEPESGETRKPSGLEYIDFQDEA